VRCVFMCLCVYAVNCSVVSAVRVVCAMCLICFAVMLLCAGVCYVMYFGLLLCSIVVSLCIIVFYYCVFFPRHNVHFPWVSSAHLKKTHTLYIITVSYCVLLRIIVYHWITLCIVVFLCTCMSFGKMNSPTIYTHTHTHTTQHNTSTYKTTGMSKPINSKL